MRPFDEMEPEWPSGKVQDFMYNLNLQLLRGNAVVTSVLYERGPIKTEVRAEMVYRSNPQQTFHFPVTNEITDHDIESSDDIDKSADDWVHKFSSDLKEKFWDYVWQHGF